MASSFECCIRAMIVFVLDDFGQVVEKLYEKIANILSATFMNMSTNRFEN